MSEFKVNKYITLKLKNDETIIYVQGKQFDQCTSLLLNIPYDELTSLNQIESIDELAERLENTDTNKYGKIPPETEFWGHCSNLQAWYESGYDTRILRSNLAFPLLEKLTEAGDLQAKKVFKEEIIKRFKSNYFPVVEYLLEEGYMDYFNKEEIQALFPEAEYIELYGEKIFVMNGHLNLRNIEIEDLFMIKGFDKLTSLQGLDLGAAELKTLSNSIGNLKSLQRLDLYANQLEKLPNSIGNLISLRTLCLELNGIKSLPKSIENLVSLRKLNITENRLKKIPKSIGKLKSLQYLSLGDNYLESLPESFGNLTSLQVLFLNDNLLKSLPKSFGNLKSLRELHMTENRVKMLPESFGNLTSLQILDLQDNKISVLPEWIGNLTSLQDLRIGGNPLKELPESLSNLKSLRSLSYGRTNLKHSKVFSDLKKRGVTIWNI